MDINNKPLLNDEDKETILSASIDAINNGVMSVDALIEGIEQLRILSCLGVSVDKASETFLRLKDKAIRYDMLRKNERIFAEEVI